MAHLKPILGPFWAHLEAILTKFGAKHAFEETICELYKNTLFSNVFGWFLAVREAILGPSWGHFGLARSPHERCWRLLGSMLPLVITLEPSWGYLGANKTKKNTQCLFNVYSMSTHFRGRFEAILDDV